MKLISLQENLKKGLSLVSHITSKNINLPILNNVLIKADKNKIELISTNLEIGVIHQIRGKVEKSGSFTVDAKTINEYVSFLPNSKVEIEEKNQELKINCDNYKTKIKGELASEFPLIPSIEKNDGFSCSISNFKKALGSVSFAVSNNENRLELSGVLFVFTGNELTLVATDSYRLAEKALKIKKIGTPSDDLRVIVPSRTIQELLRILSSIVDGGQLDNSEENINFYISENQILFSITSTDLISRLINGNYPDYKQIIPTNIKTKASINRAEFLRAIKASAIFSKAGINDVALEFKNSKIVVSSSSGLSGESRVELDTEISGEENEIIINYKYLVDGLNNIYTDKVNWEMINGSTPCILKPEQEDDYLYIVMPIRQ